MLCLVLVSESMILLLMMSSSLTVKLEKSTMIQVYAPQFLNKV